jgi:hypothetical protein
MPEPAYQTRPQREDERDWLKRGASEQATELLGQANLDGDAVEAASSASRGT